MFTNLSLFLNASHPEPTSNSSTDFVCLTSLDSSVVIMAYTTTNAFLLLPLSILVLYIGFQRWRRSTSTVTATSHADHFTYHMVVMELIGLIGSGCYCIGQNVRHEPLRVLGFYAYNIILPGQSLFHLLTCVERHLAVVHPITYLRLKKTGGNEIRHVSIGCVWLLCVGWIGVAYKYNPFFPVLPCVVVFFLSSVVSSFCSFSVLRTLTRPGPGERVGDRVDQSKQKAFQSLVVIMGALFFRFSGLLVCFVTYEIILQTGRDPCVMLVCALWFCLPSSLVLPLLFLHKVGKLACFKHNSGFSQ